MTHRPWLTIRVDTAALRANIAALRRLIAPTSQLMPVVKADGYGHGLELAASAFVAGGVDWLGVHALGEAERIRAAGISCSVLILGPLTAAEIPRAADLKCDITVGSLAALRDVVAVGHGRVHLKVETGVNRQGLVETEWPAAMDLLASASGVELAGISSHFADIEDTTDHQFANEQQARFQHWCDSLESSADQPFMRHMSCSAAAILWPSTHHDLVRVGIAAYGVWPSRETLVSARVVGRGDLQLQPALTWAVRVAQVRDVAAGESVGYGRTWRAPVDSRIAVLPVGYADGYRRALSGRAHVLIAGRRAPVCGRICMNLCMVDVTHIPGVEGGHEAVLLGRQADDEITVELMADWLGTISYEILTLPGSTWHRTEDTHA